MRGLNSKMAIDYLTVAAREYRDFETELADAAAHPINTGVVLSRIAGVRNESVDRPDLDCQRLR